jgi:hypothetical protein
MKTVKKSKKLPQRVSDVKAEDLFMRSKLEKLLKKYKKELEDFVVMDDYDGGERARLRQTITELESVLNNEYKN